MAILFYFENNGCDADNQQDGQSSIDKDNLHRCNDAWRQIKTKSGKQHAHRGDDVSDSIPCYPQTDKYDQYVRYASDYTQWQLQVNDKDKQHGNIYKPMKVMTHIFFNHETQMSDEGENFSTHMI